jgi:hypothetical protein
MRYLLTRGWVTVNGPPEAACALREVRNDPRLPRTLPNRTLRYVPVARRAICAVSRSAIRFE